MSSSFLRRRANTGIKWSQKRRASRGVGVWRGFLVREGAPWLVEVKRWSE